MIVSVSRLPEIRFDFDATDHAASLMREIPILQTKIMSACSCSRSEAFVGLRETLRFLYLVHRWSEDTLTPSHRVDLAWHEFILCTRSYQSFCRDSFGRMIHHVPGAPSPKNHSQYEQTLKRYRDSFGEPDFRFWKLDRRRVSPACGGCESFQRNAEQ